MNAAVSKAKGKKAAEKAEAKKAALIVKLQCAVRKFTAKCRVKKRAGKVWQRVFDPKFKIYFFFNKLNGQSQWNKPKLAELFSSEDIQSAKLIQKVCRAFVGKMRVRKILYSKYTRFYDPNLNKFYWMDNATQKTTFKASKLVTKVDIPMPLEDQMLHKSALKIKELEDKLKEKEKEIKDTRKKRYEELEPLVIADRVKNAKSLKRSKNMDEWTVDDVAAWFTELKMDEHIPFVFKNRVDGNLFVNLAETDWEDMGIVNKFQVRKLQIIMKAYRLRYQRKRDRIEVDEEDELMSEYAPSELSDLIAQEGMISDDDEEGGGGKREDEEEQIVRYEETIHTALTEEQKHERKLDQDNIHVHMLVAGDGKNFPMIGDIVRVRYVCSIVEGPQKGKIITSTKNGMKLLSVEFVLGVGQVIKGFDRALPQMSIGERSKITITSEYAYGKAGYFPHIPPDAEIEFDITLLGFRPRPAWVKPLIQELGYVMKPYEVTGKDLAEGVQLPDDDDSLTSKNFKGDGGAAGGGGGGGGGKKKSSDAGRKKISNAQKV